ncbi:MAG: ABC transporter permease [Verrucomicrobiota bacterium]|nr:ABC transporter permease [Verrucomicrobiota bacterium]
MLADLKYALRLLIKSPAFSAVAVLTLALGIGANTAIFSVVEGTLLRPLPFPNADRLFRIYEAADDNGARGSSLNLSEQTVRQWREHGTDIFEGIGAATGSNVTVGALNENPAQNIPTARIDANFLTVLGLRPALGRNFTAEEDQPGGPAVVIVSDDFWRQHLGAQSNALGTTIQIDGVPHTIIGIMPKTFRHPYRAHLWLPLALGAATPPGQGVNHYLYGVVRLRQGLSAEHAESAVRRMCAAINQAAPDPNNARAAYMPPLRESFVMDLRPKILVIVGAALCALLIAAANFAGLLLSRVVEREGEFALRAALGASWSRLVRQQLAQALVLAVLGTICGILFASWITPALVAMSPEGADATGSAMREFDYGVRLDWPVFAFAAGVMLFVGFAFGLLPAVRASRTDLRSAMSATGRGATLDRSTRRLLGTFVVIELAVAAALLMASLSAAQYFRKLLDEPWGFATDRRVAFNVMFSDRLFANPTAKQQSIDATLAQFRTIPGVTAATVTAPSPMNAPRDLITCNPEGSRPPEPQGFYLSYLRAAPPNYFKSVGQPLLQGREFLETDAPNSPQVCIVSNAFAHRFWPGADPIGKRVKWGRLDSPRPWLTVVGVAGEMKAIADPRDGEVNGMLARPLAQILAIPGNQMDEMTFVIETDGDRTAMDSAIRAALARSDSRLAAYQVISLEDAADQSRVTERFIFVLVSLFGVLGLILAAVGLYGLLSLQVTRRQREFGIRSALGATAAQLIRLVARQGAVLLGTGFIVAGIAGWGVIQIVRNQWSAMPPPNLIAWLLAGAVLGAAAGLACWLPARRASRVDPVIALRAE